MKRWAWGFFGFFAIAMLASQAQAALDFDKAVRYEADTLAETSAYNSAFDRALKSSYGILQTEGLTSFDSPLGWLNRIYSRRGVEKIYAKGGVHISGPIQYGKVYRDREGHYIGHVQDLVNGDHVLFFEGMSEAAARNVLTKLAGTVPAATAIRRPSTRARFRGLADQPSSRGRRSAQPVLRERIAQRGRGGVDPKPDDRVVPLSQRARRGHLELHRRSCDGRRLGCRQHALLRRPSDRGGPESLRGRPSRLEFRDELRHLSR